MLQYRSLINTEEPGVYKHCLIAERLLLNKEIDQDTLRTWKEKLSYKTSFFQIDQYNNQDEYANGQIVQGMMHLLNQLNLETLSDRDFVFLQVVWSHLGKLVALGSPSDPFEMGTR